MKIEKEPEGSWNYQLSVKLGRNGQHLLNIRAEGWDAFKEALQKITEDANDEEGSLVNDTIVALEPDVPEQPQMTLPIADARAAPPAAPVPQVRSDVGSEVGPLVVNSITPRQVISGPKAKYPGKVNTVYSVAMGNGALTADTFDKLIAQVAETLLGKHAYARVEKNRFGYNLLNVRPAA